MANISEFNEDLFIVSPLLRKDYLQKVADGYALIKNKTVAICGLARNLATIIGKTMARIERTGALFRDYSVVIFENDSIDNTAEQLLSWQKTNNKVRILSEDLNHPVNPGTRCLNRAARMALYRNICRDYIIEHVPSVDYVIIIDLDVTNGWSYDGLANTFGQTVPWDFVGSNGLINKNTDKFQNHLLHYDAWAFRWEGSWSPCTGQAINEYVLYRGQPMLRLNSCFGGLGVYRYPAFSLATARYDGTDCEHVPFHRQLIAGGFSNIYLNPSQIVHY